MWEDFKLFIILVIIDPIMTFATIITIIKVELIIIVINIWVSHLYF